MILYADNMLYCPTYRFYTPADCNRMLINLHLPPATCQNLHGKDHHPKLQHLSLSTTYQWNKFNHTGTLVFGLPPVWAVLCMQIESVCERPLGDKLALFMESSQTGTCASCLCLTSSRVCCASLGPTPTEAHALSLHWRFAQESGLWTMTAFWTLVNCPLCTAIKVGVPNLETDLFTNVNKLCPSCDT